jgi:hypothetical protein
VNDDDKMSRQVRRKLEREGTLRSEHDKKQDVQIMAAMARQRAALSKNDPRQTTEPHGKRNIYTCADCFGHIVTVDLVEGVTPFQLKCRATEGCNGSMQSSMYRVFDQRMRPDFEWYSPTKEETVALCASVREHVAKGGLILRPVSRQ